MKRTQQLYGKVRIAPCLVVQVLREWTRLGVLTGQRSRHKVGQPVYRQRLQPDIVKHRLAGRNPADRLPQGMIGSDLVRPVCADHQQIARHLTTKQHLQHPESRGIHPLKIVDEKRQRFMRTGKDANELANRQL
ncbi:conserved hypothetical protein [Ricinus communis]|uniref:Uncharacterized protein n=1 Tax=Ricinus communis TaxID=3988 RepID=B9T934_RICCO|nr:conserved hypothetical protein [Ricinus communis]